MSEISGFVELGQTIFNTIKVFVDFLKLFLTNIPHYLKTFIDFLITYVIEFPAILISMFGELPVFVQTGLIVIIYALIIAFIFRLIKLIIPFL